MKKALIFLLSLAVVGAVFAQDAPTFTLGGSLQTGFVYQMGDNKVDPVIWNFADDAGNDAYRLRVDGTAVNGNTGVKFRLQSDSEKDVFVKYAFTYVDLLEAMVTVQAGYGIDTNDWRTKGDDELDFEGSGVKVMVKPIDGLNLGGMVRLPDAEADAVELADAGYILGFAYAMAPLGVQGGLLAEEGELQAAYAGFDYADIIPGLSLYVETAFAGLNEFSDFGVIQIDEKVKYVTGPIEAALVSYQWLYQNDDIDMGLKIKGSVSYTAGNLKPAIEVVYNNDEINIDKIDDMTKEDTTAITVKPTLEVKFTDKTKVVSGYEYVAYTDLTYDNTQKLFVNFRYDF